MDCPLSWTFMECTHADQSSQSSQKIIYYAAVAVAPILQTTFLGEEGGWGTLNVLTVFSLVYRLILFALLSRCSRFSSTSGGGWFLRQPKTRNPWLYLPRPPRVLLPKI